MCLGPEEGKEFKEQEQKYRDIFAMCKKNTLKKPITNLNRELRIAVDNYTAEEKLAAINRDIDYQVKMYKDTDTPLTEDVIEKKRDWYMKHPMSTEFTRLHDTKWRHPTKRFALFNKFQPTIEDILDRLPHLKEHIYGPDNLNFRFSRTWLESRKEWTIYHALEISRCEKAENIEFTSNWDLNKHTLTFSMGGGGNRIPLRDAFRV